MEVSVWVNITAGGNILVQFDPVPGEFLAQRAGDAENVSIWWCQNYARQKHLKNII